MERAEIIKALECWLGGQCIKGACPLYEEVDGDVKCTYALLAHINELTEEVEKSNKVINDLIKEGQTYLAQRECLQNQVKHLTEDNEALTAELSRYTENLKPMAEQIKANTVREIFKEIYSSLDYIEDQMEPEEIPECFFSVREDIDALKVRFEGEGNSQTFGEGE